MDEVLDKWSKQYQLKNIKLIGYHGGYPMIEFDKEDRMKVVSMGKNEIKRVVRNCETYGGIELGVGWNFVRTALVLVNSETIIMAGHEIVISKMLNKLI